jgi:hypothetical protein
MSAALVQGLQRKVEELQDELKDKKDVERENRRLKEELRVALQKMTTETDPLACSICLESTTDVLPCNHRVCNVCMHTLVKEAGPYCRTLTCPICRKMSTANVIGTTIVTVGGRAGEPLEQYSILAKDTATVRKYAMKLHRWAELGDKHGMTDPWVWGSRSEPSSPVSKKRRAGLDDWRTRPEPL